MVFASVGGGGFKATDLSGKSAKTCKPMFSVYNSTVGLLF